MKYKIFGGHFDLDQKILELEQKENIMNSPTFWDDKDNSNLVISTISNLKNLINPIKNTKEKIIINLELLEILEENDKEMFELISSEYENLLIQINDIQLLIFLNSKYDKENCIIEIHSGAGGTESCDWVTMLKRMYMRYCKKNNFAITELDNQPGEEVGLKSTMLQIKGNYAYGYLKGEKGVHRLVRISPFDSNKRRHTTFASVEVIPEIDNNIDVKINDNDLKIDVYHSSGAGGQSVNTTDSAVRITHLPTGIVVTCQNERSQIQNKEKAIEILKSKLYILEEEKQNNELNKITEGQMSIGFGSGKRSYVMCPYTLAKDNETNYETGNVEAVLDGEIDEFIKAEIRNNKRS